MKACIKCDRPLTGAQRKYCTLCKANDPHRHTTRKKAEIIVSVDGEGTQTGEDMRMVTMSYGREDGTSNTLTVTAPSGQAGPQILAWLIDELSGPYTDSEGVEHKQVVTAFHFNWDASVISKDFTSDMMLVHKATARERGLLCAVNDCTGDCGKLHRYDPATIQDVISDGGEGSVIAWHQPSQIALAISPKRRLYVEHRPHGDRMEQRRVLDIHDTGTAFVGGLLDVIDKWQPELTDAQKTIITWGKHHRKSGFLDGNLDMVTEYSEAECVAHARTVRLLLNALRAVGIVMAPSTLFGSGSVAASAMKYHGVCPRKEAHTESKIVSGITIDQIALLTYFGGLIETPVLGLIMGYTDEVDLNSAYPAAAIELPCMREGHGMWIRKRGNGAQAPAGAVGHVLTSWVVQTPSTGPFVVRTKEGLVRQPLSGSRTWVTLAEYQMAAQQFPDDLVSHETVWWECTCTCGNPLAWLSELYDARQKIKAQMVGLKDSDPSMWQTLKSHEEAIKLIINSVYGKLAQQRPELGKYTNLHYASHITGTTRAKVRKESWDRETQGGTVVYTHTDSVLSQGGCPVDGGPKLGAWKLEKQSTDLLIVQPGLAVSLGGGKTASRGCHKDEFSKAAAEWAQATDLTRHPTTWPAMNIPRTMMISRRMAVARNRPDLAGAFLPQPLKVGFTSGKRDLENAVQMPGNPTAWIVPPILSAGEPATLEDIKQYQTRLASRIKSGEFDREPKVVTYDEIDEIPEAIGPDTEFIW